MRTKLHIVVQCHNFQRRLCWMLSSLAAQTRPDWVSVDVAHVKHNGKPETEAVAKLFRKNTDLLVTRSEYVSTVSFQYRGLVRSQQLKECTSDWIMFGDSDMVYHPEYVQRLVEHLEANHKNARHMLSSGRLSNDKDACSKMVEAEVLAEPKIVQDSWGKADKLDKRRMGNVGAGFCQIINVQHCPHGGYYVKPEENRDWSWSKGSNPRSDMQFRKRIHREGGSRLPLPDWFTDHSIHLNHDRDPEAGRHLETQR